MVIVRTNRPLVPTLRVGTHDCAAPRLSARQVAAERQDLAFPRRAWERGVDRTGGVYIVVLGTSLIVSLLGLAALVGQRIQNRILTASADITQARLNAEAAIELGVLKIKENECWRGNLNLDLGDGSSCTLQATDAPSDADPADRPITLVGIGRHGPASGDAPRTAAEQRVEVIVDPRREPLACLRDDDAELSTEQWNAVFAYYQTNGDQLAIDSLPVRTPNFGRNVSFTSNTRDHWIEQPPGLPAADFDGPEEFDNHNECLEVRDRYDRRAGAANSLKVAMLKPATRYQVAVEVHAGWAFLGPRTNQFRISLITQYADNSFVTYAGEATQVTGGWSTISSTVDTPSWSQPPTAVYVVVNSDHPSGSSHTFYVDDLEVYETAARFIYQKVLSKDVPLYADAPLNTRGIYWIDCAGQKLVIERSRIIGTLVLLNPGPGSQVAYGSYDWAPAIPGYPALLVSGDFEISGTLASDSRLFEQENNVNYNPTGAPDRDGNTDDNSEPSEFGIYESQIRGLVAVSGNLTYQNNPRIPGQVVVGGTPSGVPDFEYRPDSLLNPPPGFYTYRYDRRPASIRKAVQ